ncbi:MAG TPA: Na+/H+ antiporter subunit B [Anaerolineales bacterium]|nr:Na+/H+ antiporter subunit B [Anaerolineales bacterium]
MTSLILRTTARYLAPLLLIFSVFLFWRGHNQPGGGFAGGLVAAVPFALFSIAFGAAEARRVLHVETHVLIATGLLTALSSGVLSLFVGEPFLTSSWGSLRLPGFSSLDVGTPVLFDLGVYLLVIGITLSIIFALEEAE